MRVGILTSGGDAPGINATIRGVGKTAINHYGMQVIGIQNGFSGLVQRYHRTYRCITIGHPKPGRNHPRYRTRKNISEHDLLPR